MFLLIVDGCKNYTVLTEADRAQGNALKNNLCDGDLVTGWYRFQGAAGERIANKCVPKYHCGTSAPGWLNGSHPTVVEGAVTRRVCYHRPNDCCRRSNNIKVKNCSGFYVYELRRTPICNLRYCGNEDAGELNIFDWQHSKDKVTIKFWFRKEVIVSPSWKGVSTNLLFLYV